MKKRTLLFSQIKSALSSSIRQISPVLWLNYRILFRKEQFEPEYWLIPMFCTPEKLSIDVGANMGEYSYYMMKFSAEIVAFEPNTSLWPPLRRLLGHKVRLEPVALSDRSGSSDLRYVAENTGVATIESRNILSMVLEQSLIETREVMLRTLDSYRLENVAFIKIDVEGHEEAVIAGAKETLAWNRPAILVESENRHNPGAPRRLAETMRDWNYVGFYLQNEQIFKIESFTDGDPLSATPSGINNYLYLPRERMDLSDRLESLISKGALAYRQSFGRFTVVRF